jgi:hypothetical protein
LKYFSNLWCVSGNLIEHPERPEAIAFALSFPIKAEKLFDFVQRLHVFLQVQQIKIRRIALRWDVESLRIASLTVDDPSDVPDLCLNEFCSCGGRAGRKRSHRRMSFAERIGAADDDFSDDDPEDEPLTDADKAAVAWLASRDRSGIADPAEEDTQPYLKLDFQHGNVLQVGFDHRPLL